MKRYPVVIVTHMFFRGKRSGKARFALHDGVRQARALTVIDEQPDDVQIFDTTYAVATAVEEAIIGDERFAETVGPKVRALIEFMHDRSRGGASLERPKDAPEAWRSTDDLGWFLTDAAETCAKTLQASVPGITAVFEVAKSMAACYSFIARDGGLTRFVGFECKHLLGTGTVLLDATADIDGLTQLCPWCNHVEVPQVHYDNLSVVHVESCSKGNLSKRKISAFVLPVLGDIDCNELTTDQIRAWHNELAITPARKRSKSGQQNFRPHSVDNAEAVRRRRSTANRVLTILKAALNAAWRDERISDDKAWRRVKPFENVDAARVHYLSKEDATRLLVASEAHFCELVQAALKTGARYGELAKLVCEDFNTETGRLTIRTSKSGKSRHIVMNDEGVTFFEAMCAGRSNTDLIFKYRGTREWRASEQVREMRLTCSRAGISHTNFHALRHTWASHAVMGGVPLLLVAKNLGHTDTRMVEKHYGHLDEGFFEQTIRRSAPRFGF